MDLAIQNSLESVWRNTEHGHTSYSEESCFLIILTDKHVTAITAVCGLRRFTCVIGQISSYKWEWQKMEFFVLYKPQFEPVYLETVQEI